MDDVVTLRRRACRPDPWSYQREIEGKNELAKSFAKDNSTHVLDESRVAVSTLKKTMYLVCSLCNADSHGLVDYHMIELV